MIALLMSILGMGKPREIKEADRYYDWLAKNDPPKKIDNANDTYRAWLRLRIELDTKKAEGAL